MLPARGLYGHIRNNRMKSALLLAGFVVLIALFWFGWCLIYTGVVDGWLHAPRGRRAKPPTFDMLLAKAWGRALAMWWAPLIASAMWFGIAYAMQAKFIQWATGARAVTRKEMPRLYNLVENLTISCGMPMPSIEVMETDALNAYAAGLEIDDAVIAVTRGLLETLDDQELEAVLAHELTHIRNRDVQLMVVAGVFAGGLTLVGTVLGKLNIGVGDASSGVRVGNSSRSSQSNGAAAAIIIIGIVCLALTHLFALLSRFAISRSREFMADAGAVELTKNPDAMIRALRKISHNDDVGDIPDGIQAMMISSSLEGLFSTHPAIDDRIAALAQYAGGHETQVAMPRRAGIRGTAAGAEPQGAVGFGRRRAGFKPMRPAGREHL
jgi:heat shock protein HtpX